MKIKNAVIPVAGPGTRLLPSTKSQPKEMLPVGRKPVVQYVVEEFAAAGIERILLVTGRRKRSIEDHFDPDDELARNLEAAGKEERLEALAFGQLPIRIFYTRQSEQLGLGHAISLAEDFAGDRPFIVGLGDSIIRDSSGPSVVSRLVACAEKTGASCVVAFENVPREDVPLYGIAQPKGRGSEFELADIFEKPAVAEAPSTLAVAARYFLSPNIFDALRATKPGVGGEIQLTDAIRLLIQKGEKVYGIQLAPGEKRYDIGNFESYFKTFIEFAIADEKYGPNIVRHIRSLIS